jgi:hypothetical protein
MVLDFLVNQTNFALVSELMHSSSQLILLSRIDGDARPVQQISAPTFGA